MSKFAIKLTLKREIKKINREIDERIIRGLSYAKQARYHKDLKARLALLEQTTWLGRSMRVASFLMF